jgi:hypothetical protein
MRVVAVNKDEIYRLTADGSISTRRFHTCRPHPLYVALFDLANLTMGDYLLGAEADASDWVRVNAEQYAVYCHYAAQPAGRNAVPDADLNQSPCALRMPSQTVTLSLCRLRLGLSQPYAPE